MIQAAYHIHSGMLFGTSAWMESEQFDIDARAAGKSTLDDDMVMLRALLADSLSAENPPRNAPAQAAGAYAD